MHACDRRTDRRTDRILIARPHLHYMQRGKNRERSECQRFQNYLSKKQWSKYYSAGCPEDPHNPELNVSLSIEPSVSYTEMSFCAWMLSFQLALKWLNACWNMAFRKFFVFHRWESVKTFICGLQRLDFKHIYALICFKFWKCVY